MLTDCVFVTLIVAQILIGFEEIVSSARQKITSKVEDVSPELVAISTTNLVPFKTMMFFLLAVSVLYLFYELFYHQVSTKIVRHSSLE